MNDEAHKYAGWLGKMMILALFAGMIFIMFIGMTYRHGSVAHRVFGKTDTDSLFFEPTEVSVVPEAVAEQRADGTCGCPYCCAA